MSIAVPSDDAGQQQLALLLSALTQNDTQTIRQAEQALKPLLKDPRCVPALLEILKGTGPSGQQLPAVRQVAAIVLRKRLPGHYSKFDAASKSQFKSEILQVLASEPERSVRNAIVAVAASLTKLECGTGGTSWPEVFQFIAAAAADAHAEARELAFMLLEEMTDTIGEHLKPQFKGMASLFSSALTDANPKVQKASLKALGQLLSYLADEPDVEVFSHLLPPIFQVAALNATDEDTISVVLDVMYDLAYSPSPSITVYLKDMVSFSLQILQAAHLDMGVRDSAALVIATLAEAKPKTFGKEEVLLGQVLESLFLLIENSPDSAAGALFESNPAWKQDIDDEDGDYDPDAMDSPSETSMAQGTLDMLACEIPKKYFFNPAVSRCMQRLQSPNPHTRKAGIAGLGVIAEGCAEKLREHLPDVIPHVLTAAGDADAHVRECACFCLGQLSEHCQPEILSYSSQILPIVFALLNDTAVTVQATSCYVLETFCERLEPEAVRPSLDPLVRKLAHMLESTNKRSVQEMAVAALAATAVAAEEEFTPYVTGVASLMTNLMSLREEKLFSLRGRAMECMGHIAIAVGRDVFRPYFEQTMQCAGEGLTWDSTDLHEFAYALFANLAKVMKEEFAPALEQLVPHLITVIGSDEGQVEAAQEDEEQEGEFGALDDSDDEDADGGKYVLHVRTALLELKKGAITAIGEMAAYTGPAFCPHLEVTMQVLQTASSNWHPSIKSAVAEALPSLVMPSLASYHNGEITWTKGDLTSPNPMSQHTAAIVTAVMAELVPLMKDDDKTTVSKACEAIQSVIESCGPHALIAVAPDCLSNAHDLLCKKAACQTTEEVYGEYPEDDDDHDGVMQATCDLVGAFGRVMGQHFAQYLPQFLPAICEYGRSSRPPSDRSMAMGCLSEIAQELQGAILEHWPTVFFPAVVAGLNDSDDNVKRNAAFCAGLCCEHLGEHITVHYPQILQALSTAITVDSTQGEASAACVDNAAAAVARMIMASPSHVPLPQVLPQLLKVLPLETDMTENGTVYTCLIGLLQLKQPDLLALRDEVVRIFTEASSDASQVDDETKEKLKMALQTLL